MGPVELTFFIVLAIFAVIGIVRGVGRELGVRHAAHRLIVLLLLDTTADDSACSSSSLAPTWPSRSAWPSHSSDGLHRVHLIRRRTLGFFHSYSRFRQSPVVGGELAGGIRHHQRLSAGGHDMVLLACANSSKIGEPFSSLYYAISAILPP
jgi:hypothetical protein